MKKIPNFARPAFPVVLDEQKRTFQGMTKIEFATVEIAAQIAAVAVSAAFMADGDEQQQAALDLAVSNTAGIAYAIALNALKVCNEEPPEQVEENLRPVFTFAAQRPDTGSEIEVMFEGGEWLRASVYDDSMVLLDTRIEYADYFSFRVILEGGKNVPQVWRNL